MALMRALTLASLMNTAWDFYRLAEFHDGTRYTIHGCWPSRSDSWPEFCPGPRFNETQLLPLEPRLERDWPNAWGSSLALHKHEYLRHGTCSGLPEVEYFSRCLEAYERYDLNRLVRASREPPDGALVARLFQEEYGKALRFDRWKVSFCLSKDWDLIDCA